MNKALHEAKVHTSWINPDAEYDAAIERFVGQSLTNADFTNELCDLVQKVGRIGVFNSLAQSLIRCMAPGVPDTYQGTENIDLSLVDPDNRRPVDFDCLSRMLSTLDARAAEDRVTLVKELTKEADDAAKLYVIAEALRLRKRRRDLFETGLYEPVEVEGEQALHVFAFLRSDQETAVLVVTPRLIGTLCPAAHPPVGAALWSNTRLVLPDRFTRRGWRNIFTNESGTSTDVGTLLEHFPVALVEFQ
jgi:(1->4)-alpha-D-glucan 1-alpha-D-glucosylmutase